MTETTLQLLNAIEDFLKAQQAFSDNGGPDKWKRYTDAEIHLKKIVSQTKLDSHNE
jgi:hypothetical protein